MMNLEDIENIRIPSVEIIVTRTKNSLIQAWNRFQEHYNKNVFRNETQNVIRRAALATVATQCTINYRIIESVRSFLTVTFNDFDRFLDKVTSFDELNTKDRSKYIELAYLVHGITQTVQRQLAKDSTEKLEECRVLGPSEKHCPQCIAYAELGWVPIGTLPISGQSCYCGLRCNCKLQTRIFESLTNA